MPQYNVQKFVDGNFEIVTARGEYTEAVALAVDGNTRLGLPHRIVRDGRVLMYFVTGQAMTADEAVVYLARRLYVPTSAPAEIPTVGPSVTPITGPDELKEELAPPQPDAAITPETAQGKSPRKQKE